MIGNVGDVFTAWLGREAAGKDPIPFHLGGDTDQFKDLLVAFLGARRDAYFREPGREPFARLAVTLTPGTTSLIGVTGYLRNNRFEIFSGYDRRDLVGMDDCRVCGRGAALLLHNLAAARAHGGHEKEKNNTRC